MNSGVGCRGMKSEIREGNVIEEERIERDIVKSFVPLLVSANELCFQEAVFMFNVKETEKL